MNDDEKFNRMTMLVDLMKETQILQVEKLRRIEEKIFEFYLEKGIFIL